MHTTVRIAKTACGTIALCGAMVLLIFALRSRKTLMLMLVFLIGMIICTLTAASLSRSAASGAVRQPR